jgi:sugar/nucleoside kinase (ribokinase family)
MTPAYDLVFMGSASIDEIHTFQGPVQTLFGGGVVFSSTAAVWSGKRIAVVTRMAERDAHMLQPLRDAGIDVYVTYTPETTRHRAFHLSEDVDQRQIVLERSAGAFTVEDLPSIQPTFLHLAGLTDQEFTVAFMRSVRELGHVFSVDLQGQVRQADLGTGEVTYADVADKVEIAQSADKLKLDALEATYLTGTAEPEIAAARIEGWGASEIMVTRADGAVVRHRGETFFERFSTSSVEGRTGRGDTTFGSYLASRLDRSVPDSLKLAATVASMKMERPGPFTGTFEQIVERMGG